MTSIDLLSRSGKSMGAGLVNVGVEVTEPWGSWILPSVELREGWYELLVLDADCGVSLELREERSFLLIELQADIGKPAFVRLSGGFYEPSVRVGARPGVYRLEQAILRPFPRLNRYGLLASRFFQAVLSGSSFPRLYQLVRLALTKGKTYGIRSTNSPDTNGLGVLSRYDLEVDLRRINFEQRLARLNNFPRFFLRGSGGQTLSAQTFDEQLYRHFTLDEAMEHDYVVTVAPHERLTADALLLFAEHVERNPTQKLVLADKWILQKSTAHVAWDPLLYRSTIPTPYVHSVGYTPEVNFSNRADLGIVPVPLARTDIPEACEDFAKPHNNANSEKPPCSIIIPTRDRSDLLGVCLCGLFEKTDWPHEVIVIDNGSVEPETAALLEKYRSKGLRTIRADVLFNYSLLCNIGVREAVHPYIVLLNNDVVLDRSDWLSEMMAFATMREVGAVGARLLYEDGRLQHAGVMLGLTQICGHLWRGLDAAGQAGEPRIEMSSVRTAVTAACLCVEKEKYNRVGGLNESQFAVTLNDVDLCLKLGQAGLLNVYAAKAIAYHHESESRGDDTKDSGKSARRSAELTFFNQTWAGLINSDPWLPAGISRSTEVYKIR